MVIWKTICTYPKRIGKHLLPAATSAAVPECWIGPRIINKLKIGMKQVQT